MSSGVVIRGVQDRHRIHIIRRSFDCWHLAYTNDMSIRGFRQKYCVRCLQPCLLFVLPALFTQIAERTEELERLAAELQEAEEEVFQSVRRCWQFNAGHFR